uniref:Uncharacterized protein n=1 Tax=Anopheles melas TaxID=34690 RepID=A0A182U686_9DIPT
MMEAYIRQKRATPGMVQASDLQLVRPMSGVNRNGREVHAYDGPMQFMMSPTNPDQIMPTSPVGPVPTVAAGGTGPNVTATSITTTPTSPYSDLVMGAPESIRESTPTPIRI